MDSNTSNKGIAHWISSHFVLIIMIIAGSILALSLIKLLNQLFNGDGPVSQGIADILGSGANLLNGLMNGCVKQDDCVNLTEKQNCLNGNGCSWNTEQTDINGKVTPASCMKTHDGVKTGEGGFFTPSCALGMGALIFGVASLLNIIFGPIIAYFLSKNKNAEKASTISGDTISETNKEIIDNSRSKIEELKNDPDIKEARDKLNKKQQESFDRLLAGKVTNVETVTFVSKIINKHITDGKEREREHEQSVQNKLEKDQEIDNNEVSEENNDLIDEKSNDNPDLQNIYINLLNSNINPNIRAYITDKLITDIY